VSTDLLTLQQQAQIKQIAADTDAWRNEADLDRRRGICRELQELVKRSGLLEGKTLTDRQLAEMVGLQWQIQNLNPMQMPRFLGLQSPFWWIYWKSGRLT
jgi:hypothetical protein